MLFGCYKNGVRSVEFLFQGPTLIRKVKKIIKKRTKNLMKRKEKLDIEFTVQILVTDQELNADQLKSLEKLKDVEKTEVGTNMFAYYAGSLLKFRSNKRLNEAKNVGFENAFIFASENGVRITIEEALDK